MACCFTLQFERKLQNSIIMGITIFKFSFGEVYRRIYGYTDGNHVLLLRSNVADRITSFSTPGSGSLANGWVVTLKGLPSAPSPLFHCLSYLSLNELRIPMNASEWITTQIQCLRMH